MLVPIKWLYEFVPCDKNPKELAELFTAKGVEVKGISRVGEKLINFVIAEVKSATSTKATLFDGKNTIEVSTPAFNLKASDKVAYNPKESKLLSSMLAEIGQDSLPIILDSNYTISNVLLNYLDDYVLDLEILPNRSDLMSVIGLARELASYEEHSTKFANQSPPVLKKSDNHDIKELFDLAVDKQGCPDYLARLIFDIKIVPSPFWLQWRLIAVGLRPINNIVDATNYMMVKYGTPLHAFDYDKITNHSIEVRFANKGEKIKTIDGTVQNLNENVLVIADKKYPVALAGIMGGIDTEISSSTKKVLLECARFSPKVIRRGGKHLNVSTEASQRFEMGIDSQILETASMEVSNLIAELGNGAVINNKLEVRTVDKPVSIKLSQSKANTLLGINLEKERIKKILIKMNCEASEQGSSFLVKVPSYRLDLQRDVDLIEEIARIFGYDNIPSVFSLQGKEMGAVDDLSHALTKIRDFFVGSNFIENYTVSFCDESTAMEFTNEEIVKIPIPLNERYAVLRPLILTTLLDSVKVNYARGNKNLRLFEIGKVFKQAQEPQEFLYISAVMVGQNFPIFWQHNFDSSVTYFDIKGVLETFLDYLKIKGINFADDNYKFLNAKNAVSLKYADTGIGFLGEIKKAILDRFDIPVPVFGLELDIQTLLKLAPAYRFFQLLPRFPSVVRDFSFIVDDKISAAKISQSIQKIVGVLLESVDVFDYFQGKPLPAGKRNLGIRISLRSEERTLNQTEINKIFDRIVNHLKDEWQIDLRA
jgi:phenylalanyl-tRNA synthetase beta chain